jgi:hypothetical protein
MRQEWIDAGDVMSVVQQCSLSGVSRATFYAQQRPSLIDESELLICCLIDGGVHSVPVLWEPQNVYFPRECWP